MEVANKLASFYSYAKTALEVMEAANIYLGLEEPKPDAFVVLSNRIDLVGASETAKLSKTIASDAIAEAELGLHDLRVARAPGVSPFEVAVRQVNADDHTYNAANRLSHEDVYLRTFSESMTDNSNGGVCCADDWKRAIPQSQRPVPDPFNLVYDWRLGLPAAMQAIGMRITVLAGLNPEFRSDPAIRAELMTLRRTLVQHYRTMLSGIQCSTFYPKGPIVPIGVHDECYQACADVYSGTAQARSNLCDPLRFSSMWTGVSQLMPFFQVRTMIDNLYDLANPSIDATREAHVLSFDEGVTCAVVRDEPTAAGVTVLDPGNHVAFEPCNASAEQEWVYDRQSHIIFHPVSGKCLDTASVVATKNAGKVWGVPLAVMDCGLSKINNQWTFDPEAGVLQNAMYPHAALTVAQGTDGPFATVLPRARIDSSLPPTSRPYFETTLDPNYYAATRFDVPRDRVTGQPIVAIDETLALQQRFKFLGVPFRATFGSGNMQQGPWSLAWLTGDVDDDGRMDLIQPWDSGGSLGVNVFHASDGGFTNTFGSGNVGGGSAALAWLTGRVNPDRRTDIIQPFDNGGRLGINAYQSDGTGYQLTFSNADMGQGSGAVAWLTGDVDGDQLTDVIQPWDNNGELAILTYRSNGSGYELLSSTTGTQQGPWGLAWLTGDVDADERTDIIQPWDNGGRLGLIAYRSNGVGFETLFGSGDMGEGTGALAWLTGDVDRDGRTDLIQPWDNNGRLGLIVYRSDGTAFSTLYSNADMGRSASATAWLTGDVDGDGRTDLIQPFDNGGRLGITVWRSTGVGFTLYSHTEDTGQGPWAIGWFTGDTDRDGKTDLLQAWDAGGVLGLLSFKSKR